MAAAMPKRARVNAEEEEEEEEGTTRPPPTNDGTASTTAIGDLTDDLLEIILARTKSLYVLIRATTTCKLWRRTIAGDGFFHRFRAIHAPCVLGIDDYRLGSRTIFIPSAAPPGVVTMDVSKRAFREVIFGKLDPTTTT
ncbi:hypothetical protein QOZ80_5BG0443750 [Eleusine coracana subsp. coracana]|nr:hypothetical protein QOZ80_5BG0443750 [Eleusine coracana subsp. coracana]